MRRSLPLAAFAAAAALAGAALASQDDRPRAAAPQAEWMSVSEIAAKLEAQGYQVHEIEREDGGYEVEAFDANGLRMEAWIDPVTGEPARGREREE
ncbi:MAG: PepSY domain-containing protein [Pseudomonadota bacterium]